MADAAVAGLVLAAGLVTAAAIEGVGGHVNALGAFGAEAFVLVLARALALTVEAAVSTVAFSATRTAGVRIELQVRALA